MAGLQPRLGPLDHAPRAPHKAKRHLAARPGAGCPVRGTDAASSGAAEQQDGLDLGLRSSKAYVRGEGDGTAGGCLN